MKRYLALPLLLFAAVLPAWGEIPVELVSELTLPAHAGWDVQYVMDDTTLSWVWATTDNVIHWVEEPGATEQQFALPESIDTLDSWWWEDATIRWVRLSAVPDHFCVIWQRESNLSTGQGWDVFYRMTHRFCLFDLTTGQLLDTLSLAGGRVTAPEDIPYNGRTSSTIASSQVWPPLPAVSRIFLLARTQRDANESLGDYRYGSFEGRLFLIDLAAGQFTPGAIWNMWGDHFSVFTDTAQTQFAFTSYRSSYQELGDDYQTWHSDWIGLASLNDASRVLDTNRCCLGTTQQDVSGIHRLIQVNGLALNPSTFTELWQNDSLNIKRAFRLAPDVSEVLVHHSWRVQKNYLYRGQDGALVDSIEFPNEFIIAVIRNYSHSDALVTEDLRGVEDPHDLHVYRPLPPIPQNLTCRLNPTDGMIYLRWRAVGMATAYRVWAGTEPGQCDELVATVEENVYAFPVTGAPELRFFHVTVEY